MLTGSFPGALTHDPSLRPRKRLQLPSPPLTGRALVWVLWRQARNPGPWAADAPPPGTGHCAQLCAAFSAPH